MKLRRIRGSLQLAAVCLLLGAYSLAAVTYYLYVVQGIPGRDISDTLHPGLPIDVLLNGESCQPRALTFGNNLNHLSSRVTQGDLASCLRRRYRWQA